MAALLQPESIRLARASWDEATPASRVFLLSRSRYAMRKALSVEDQALFSCPWEELNPELAEAVAWDVQFMRRVLRAGQDALRAALPPLREVAA